MKKYLVRITSVATGANPNFAGDVSVAYSGKGGKILGIYGNHCDHTGTRVNLSKYMIAEYGYNRICDAKHSWDWKNYKVNDDRGFWESVINIEEFEV